MNQHLSHIFLPTAILLFSLAIGATPAQAAQRIVIGQVADLSGPDGEAARDYIAGAKVYFDYINANGGINGVKIEHSYRDSAGNPAKAVLLTKEYIDKDRVNALFGFVGEEGIEAVRKSGILDQYKVPLIAPLTGVAQRAGETQIFINRPSYVEETRKAVQHATMLGAKRFVALYVNNHYGITALQALEDIMQSDPRIQEKWNATGDSPQLLAKREIPISGVSARMLDSLIALKPQVVIVIGDTLTVADVVKRYRVQDRGVFIVALSIVNHTTLSELAGAGNAAGTMITQVVPSPFRGETPLVREHLKLMKTYRDEPPSHLTLEGFIAAKVMVQALRQAGRDVSPVSIRAAMHNLRDIDMQGSIVGISSNGNYGWKFVDVTMLRANGTLLQ